MRVHAHNHYQCPEEQPHLAPSHGFHLVLVVRPTVCPEAIVVARQSRGGAVVDLGVLHAASDVLGGCLHRCPNVGRRLNLPGLKANQ